MNVHRTFRRRPEGLLNVLCVQFTSCFQKLLLYFIYLPAGHFRFVFVANIWAIPLVLWFLSNALRLPSLCITRLIGDIVPFQWGSELQTSQSEEGLKRPTIPLPWKRISSIFESKVFDDQIEVPLHKISRLPFCCKESLYTPFTDWRWLPFFMNPVGRHLFLKQSAINKI